MHDSVQAGKTGDARLAEHLTEIAVEASRAILSVDFHDAGTRLKHDGSPVSLADETAHDLILQELHRRVPGMAVISEEAAAEWHGRAVPDEFLLVDPLDGTKEFLAGRAEYTVNIALVRDGTPTVGMVAAPALGLIWRGVPGSAERLRFLLESKRAPRRAHAIHTRRWPADERVAAVSRSHFDPVSDAFLKRVAPVRPLHSGSALKFCRLAEGALDIYPRLSPTSEWDVAAGHALVAAAGGVVLAPDGGPLRYGRATSNFHVPGFIAWGDEAAAKRILAQG